MIDAAAYASSEVNVANLRASDAIVLVGWLCARVERLEALLAEIPPTMPDLPSHVHGFGCYPKRDELIFAAYGKAMEARRAETQSGSVHDSAVANGDLP